MRKYPFPIEEALVEPKLPEEDDGNENDVNFNQWTKLVGDYRGEMKETLESEVEEVRKETEYFRNKVSQHDTLRKIQKRELLQNTNQDFKNNFKKYIMQRPNPQKLDHLYSKISSIVGTLPITENNSALYESYSLDESKDVEKMRLRYLVSKLEKEYKKSRKREKFLLETSFYFSKIIYKQQNYIDNLKKMYTKRELQVLKLKDLVSRISENKEAKDFIRKM